jgi:hypothetical protein
VEAVTLGEQQRLFARQVGELIQYIYSHGYECTLDWCYRPPEVAAYYASLGIGIRSSLHTKKLAIDLNLFKDGEWLRSTEDHRPIGEWWERQHPLCRWGGRFGDGNHYSSERDGIK